MDSPPPAPLRPEPGQPCPCGSGRPLAECCAPLLGGEPAATAEALMRARFTAHVVRDARFLHVTDQATAGRPYAPGPDDGAPATVWTRLVIHAHESGTGPDTATVDFSAYGTEDGVEQVLHEQSEFRRIQGRWIYHKALRLGPAPYKSAAPKVGRNDPCPCGSGRKFKHCCLAQG